MLFHKHKVRNLERTQLSKTQGKFERLWKTVDLSFSKINPRPPYQIQKHKKEPIGRQGKQNPDKILDNKKEVRDKFENFKLTETESEI